MFVPAPLYLQWDIYVFVGVLFLAKYEKNLVELLQLLVRKYLNSATFH